MNAEIILYIAAIVIVNAVVLKTLLSVDTYKAMFILMVSAVVVPAIAYVIVKFLLPQSLPLMRGLPFTLAFGFTGQILMFFFRNLILVKMRDVRAKAFGQKIAPSQGFAKDYLLHMPDMRNEALIVFVIITVVEVAMLVVPRL